MKVKILILIIAIILLPNLVKAEDPTILINELAWMGTENSSNDEWLELYNSTEQEIDLTGWRLEAVDGSPLINLSGVISANGYFLLERTDDDTVPDVLADQFYTGSLSNTGEWLKLYDEQNNLVDEINPADGWPGGDNTTKQTLERAADLSWQTSVETWGTPKAENSLPVPDQEATEESDGEEYSQEESTEDSSDNSNENVSKGDIVLNEVCPNPPGLDLENEFIEIKNISDKRVDLTDWRIANSGKQEFIISSIQMAPKSIITFYRNKTKIALNNNKDKITLYSKAGKIISQLEYKTAGPEGQSYQRNDSGKYFWKEISPGENNYFDELVLPVAVIQGPKEGKINQIMTFEASDSFDPINRDLKFFWQLGEGRINEGIKVKYILFTPGNYNLKLKAIVDKNASSTEILKIKISDPNPKTSKPAAEKPKENATSTQDLTTPETQSETEIPFIFLSEFLPNPQGADDEGEFIEIFSQENKPINLSGWKLDDAEGGSKPYIIPEGTIIKPGQFMAFFRTQTKIALNNSDETVRLIMTNNTIIDQTSYEESKEGISFVLDEQFSWQQTKTPSPGEINVLDILENENNEAPTSTESSPKTEPKVLGVKTEEIVQNSPKNKNKYAFAGVSAIAVLGLGTALKLKTKKQ